MGVNGIYGLSGSGLDIESLVKMGMSSKNKQYDKMEQQEIANTWLKEAYNNVYNDLTTYKYGTLSTYKMQSNLNAMSATSSNSGVVTATANGAAASMNHTVTIESVASNAYLLTAQKDDGTNYGVTRANTLAPNSNLLQDVLFQKVEKLGESEEGVGTYKLNGSTTVNGSDVAISLRLKDTAGDDAKEYTLTYTYDELFQGEKTLNDFASAIARTGANIQGGYDTANDSFSFYNKTSGENNIIGITADNDLTAKLLNNLNLGAYDVTSNTLGPRIDFTADNTMPTIMESGGITRSDVSASLKDVLGLKATSVKTGDNTYEITVTQLDSAGKTVGNLGTYSVTKNGDTIDGAGETVFSLNLSNGEVDGEGNPISQTISFTLGELFNMNDVGQKTNLNSKADLSDFASKITNAGLGIEAEYDAANDSFTVFNPSGKAELTAAGDASSANTKAADSLIKSLNLQASQNLNVKTVTNTGTVGGILDISSVLTGMWTNASMTKFGVSMAVSQSTDEGTSSVANIDAAANSKVSPSYWDGTYANQTLFSFNIGDGTNTASVDITYGDVIDFAGMSRGYGGESLIYRGTELYQPGTLNVQPAQNNLGTLAEKINAAAKANGVNITAEYDSATGQFSLVNPNGNVILTDADGSKVQFASKLNLGDGDKDSVTYLASKRITRVNANSTDDDLASALGVGVSAVKTGTVDGVDTMKITKADGTTVDVKATDTAFKLMVGDSNAQAEVKVTYGDLFFDADGSGNYTHKGDLSTLAAKINAVATDKGINVTAAYDEANSKFSLTNDHGYATLTGGDSIGSTLVSMMGLKENADTAAAKDHSWAGTNAKVSIDGKTYNNDTNKLTVAGVTYNFLDASPVDTQGNRVKATISVTQDTDKIVDYMKSFVEEYNKLIDSLNEKLSEQKYSDYKPLSKRQEDEMTEKQIEKWTEKAKSGLLYHNSTIRDLVSAMREAIYTKVDAVDSEYNSLSAIGITSTNIKGHLTLDTDKLRKALADDPDCVYQLFASDQDSSYIAGSTSKNKITAAQQRMDYANTGVANRLYNVMTNYMDKISDIAGTSKETDDQSYLGKLITNMQTRMSNFKTQMTAYENKLFKRYDAMEVALSRLSMQLSYVSGSFS